MRSYSPVDTRPLSSCGALRPRQKRSFSALMWRAQSDLAMLPVQARAEEAMKRSADVAHLEWLEPESDEGNVEYKLRLKDPSTMRFQQLVTQMKFRLSEGNGECFYYLGEPF